MILTRMIIGMLESPHQDNHHDTSGLHTPKRGYEQKDSFQSQIYVELYREKSVIPPLFTHIGGILLILLISGVYWLIWRYIYSLSYS